VAQREPRPQLFGIDRSEHVRQHDQIARRRRTGTSGCADDLHGNVLGPAAACRGRRASDSRITGDARLANSAVLSERRKLLAAWPQAASRRKQSGGLFAFASSQRSSKCRGTFVLARRQSD
jgi:hypothetical protein